MQKKIVILGNSGFARECFIMLRGCMDSQPDLSFRGFLSFEGFAADLKELTPLFLGDDDDYAFSTDEQVIIAIGEPILRKKAHEKLISKGVHLYNLHHTESYVDKSSVFGAGNIFGKGCYVTCNSTIGSCNVFNGLIHVGHDSQIGDYNFLGPGAQVLGCVTVGSLNSIGTMSVLLPHSSIGDNNVIAPLSAVYKGCKSNTYLSGNPALKIGTRKS